MRSIAIIAFLALCVGNTEAFAVLIDDGTDQLITTREPLKLAEGYVLQINHIDVNESMVYLDLLKDNIVIDSKVVSPSKDRASDEDKIYRYKKDIGNSTNVTLIEVHFEHAWQGWDQDVGTVSSVKQISENPDSLATRTSSVVVPVSPAGDHIGVVGEHEIDEFLINWTDNKNYSELKPSVEKWDEQTTNFYLYAMENSTDDDSTLWYDISWHPDEKRRSTLKPARYPWDITADEIDLRSDIPIQGKKGILVRIKEEKIYNGPGNKPTVIDPIFYACYFPDDYTEVVIRGPTAKWTESEFKSILESVVITPPAGYY